MAQPILKRRLNPLLLISTVAALALLAGVSVIAQDQISQKQTQVNELRDTNSNLNRSVNELESRLENRSIKLRNLENEVNKLRTEKENLTNKVDDKDEKIRDLEGEIQQQEDDFSAFNSTGSIGLRDLNDSLEEVCVLGAPFNGEDPTAAENACERHGHEVGLE